MRRGAERSAAGRLVRRRDRRDDPARRGAGAGRRSVHHHARRPRRGAARARAAGDEVRTVIAGYHWFTDWGRDTMISLEGLTLATGRHREAGYILRTFAHYVRDGLIPNMFPEGEQRGALPHRRRDAVVLPRASIATSRATGDRATLRAAAADARSTSSSITSRARGSASASIRPTGCCARAQEGYQLTWMDAKVGDWVVTPRRGKAVEINALWYNALRLLDGWMREQGGDAGGDRARRARATGRASSFNRRFWYAEGGYLYDVVDGEQRRRSGVPAEPDLRDLARPSGARRDALGAGARGRAGAAADAGRPALAGAGPPRLQGDVLRRPARARRRLPPGHGLGAG